MRAVPATLLAITALLAPATAHAADGHQVDATCSTTPAEFLWDHTGVAVTYASAVASGHAGTDRTDVTCTVSWTYSSPHTLGASNAGPVAVATDAGFVSGFPTVCVQASAHWLDGHSVATATTCVAGSSASAHGG